MKLSFSFSKAVAPKKQALLQEGLNLQDRALEVQVVSEASGVMTVEKSDSDDVDGSGMLIPCKTNYTKPAVKSRASPSRTLDGFKVHEGTSGMIFGGTRPDIETSGTESYPNEVGRPPKKQNGSSSILMQIRSARERGDIVDAPDQERRDIDPEKFGWAILRGMGYDPATDSSPDASKPVVGNQAKLGLGVKNESVLLPHERAKDKVQIS
jgi:hypothetical protein